MKVFVVCSGLGQVNRGFESFTRELFHTLLDEPGFDLWLFKGGGKSGEKERRLPNLSRSSLSALWLGKLLNRQPYIVEQLTFTLSLLPYLLWKKPDIIFFSDGNIGNQLVYWKKLTRSRFKLLYSNGGPLRPPFFHWDHIHQITPHNLQEALNAGESPDRQTLLPYGFDIARNQPLPGPNEKLALRRQLGLPLDQPIVLSVGAVNQSHKRMGYLIKEISRFNPPRPFLLILGQSDAETPALNAQATELLGKNGFLIKTVPQSAMTAYYQAADVFVLASLHEGFGRVIVEAMAQGLPCVVHDSDNMHYVLGEYGFFGNFELRGSLAEKVWQVLAKARSFDPIDQQRSAYNRFSWHQLKPDYLAMLQRCLASES